MSRFCERATIKVHFAPDGAQPGFKPAGQTLPFEEEFT